MTDEEREHYERLAKYYASKSSKEPKSIYEHIKLLANDYKCWDNSLTHDEAIELDRLINQKSCYKVCHKWDSMLEDIKAELEQKLWRDAQGQIVTQDGFNHGIITAIDILDRHIMEIRK
ncbi:MAG: hypothetical protein J5725_13000 [Bacteroidales bacterium]|nr:hypothetical protein [Bacteroidales bacterium]